MTARVRWRKAAHFYRSLQIDAHGNPINKRNAWATRAVVYVRLIPPGAADTVHYRVHIPENAGNKITLHARLCYRKFTWYGTHEAFAGVPDPSKPDAVAADYDDRPTLFTASLSGVSAKQEKIPELPIVAIAEDEVTLPVVAHSAREAEPKTVVKKEEWQRWNDYGIGLFLQGDLKGAAAAFQKVTEADPAIPTAGSTSAAAPFRRETWRVPALFWRRRCNFLPIWRVRISSTRKFCVPMGTMKTRPLACEVYWRSIRGIVLPSMISAAFSFCSANTLKP